MKNKLAYLGFIGFLGLLGPFSFLGDITWAWFLTSFFFFFTYAKVVPDELFMLHIRIAATRAFFVAMVLGIILVLSVFIFENLHIIRLLAGISVFAPIGTFIINLEIFERREKKGLQNAT
ncbi:DUF3796 domain-containing protein [Bacillus sp. JJ722]|uniref:DUF3796 domain-containing protein n=1 Tax=Bacillus sp. JJ722 TaxID=3122973 RepID=UPI002FFF60FE